MHLKALLSHRFAILYTCIAIALLTLNPFQFQAYDSAEWWVWRFSLPDVLQNILLFIPLGILLRHSLRLPYSLCLIWGFCLSCSIETTQLFIAARTSNFIDLTANSASALIGAWLYDMGIYKAGLTTNDSTERDDTHPSSSNLALAVMLLPLCWTRVIITEWQPNGVWILVPSAIALLVMLQSSSRQPFLLNQTQFLVLLLALAPLATARPLLFLPLAGTSLLIHALVNRSGIPRYYLAVGTVGIGLGLIIRLNILWSEYLSHHFGEGWHNLHWIEILLSLMVLISTILWGKVNK